MTKSHKLSIQVDPAVYQYFQDKNDKDTVINDLLSDYMATHPTYYSESGEPIDFDTEMEIETSDWEGFGGEWDAEAHRASKKPGKKKQKK